mmetsp:Transcript_34014/g.90176  ORF Transcript_34014/g.90176 Transcript_34014/m.90176 type:complete len:229 (-) Transcript_34014:546-1232(-)
MSINVLTIPAINIAADPDWKCRSRNRSLTGSTDASMASESSGASSIEEQYCWAEVEDDTSEQAPLATRLGQERRGEPLAPMVWVKNTFIEMTYSDDDEDDEEFGSRLVRRIQTWSTSEDDTRSRRQKMLGVLAPLQALREVSGEEAEAEPLELRQPRRSAGSAGHEEGSCRPCAWFWRPQGCANGADCRHCHLCRIGEVKARRKANRASVREQSSAAAEDAKDGNDSD